MRKRLLGVMHGPALELARVDRDLGRMIAQRRARALAIAVHHRDQSRSGKAAVLRDVTAAVIAGADDRDGDGLAFRHTWIPRSDSRMNRSRCWTSSVGSTFASTSCIAFDSRWPERNRIR